MKEKKLGERIFEFAVSVAKFINSLPYNRIYIEMYRQLLNSSMSMGANWEEASGGLTDADFIHSANISKKEARETRYWLKVFLALKIGNCEKLKSLYSESDELTAILTSIVKKHRSKYIKYTEKLFFSFLSAVILPLSFILYPLSFVYAAKIYPSAGSTSASFLKIGVGARSVSMAGAFTAVAGDPYSIYWNPAGLFSLKGTRDLSFSHNDYFQGLKQEFLTFSLDAKKVIYIKNTFLRDGVAGFSLNYLSIPKDLEKRSGLNEDDPLNPLTSAEGKFSADDLAFKVAYAFKFAGEWNGGAAVKFIRQSIENESGSTFALDVGVMRDLILFGREFRGGFSVLNIGPGVKFVSRRYDLPLIFNAGLSHKLSENSLVSFDIEKRIDNYPFFKIGTEQVLGDKLVLRAGYKYRMHGNELGAVSGIASGVGFRLKNFSFDYAFSPYGDLGNSHIISLSLRFGRPFRKRIVPAGRLVMAGEQIENAKTFLYEINSKPVRISARGILYNIEARSSMSDIRGISFKTEMRGPAAVSLLMKEGQLPEKLLKNFPVSYDVLKAFQFVCNVRTSGALSFEFKARQANEGKIFLFYLTASGWKQVEAKEAGVLEAGYKYFKANVPLSTHFVIGKEK